MGVDVLTLALAKKMMNESRTHYTEEDWIELEEVFLKGDYPYITFDVDYNILKTLAVNRKTSKYFLNNEELFFKEDDRIAIIQEDYIEVSYSLSDNETSIYMTFDGSTGETYFSARKDNGLNASENFKILIDNSKVKPIEEKYLINAPKSDWEEKDELNPSYILNKTHYKYDGYEELIEYSLYVSDCVFYASWDLPYDYSICYKIVYDDQIYNLRPYGYEDDLNFGGADYPFRLNIWLYNRKATLSFTDGQPHNFSLSAPREFYKTLDKNFLPKEILENTKKERDFVLLKDQANNYNYIIQIENGSIISQCQCEKIYIETEPTKMIYMDGEAFDPAGMVVKAILADGTVKKIDQYVYNHCVSKEQSNFIITYEEAGEKYDAILTLVIEDFDPEEVLLDFEYVCIDQNNYLLTDWKGTYKGEQSDKIIIPDNNKIVLYGGSQ